MRVFALGFGAVIVSQAISNTAMVLSGQGYKRFFHDMESAFAIVPLAFALVFSMFIAVSLFSYAKRLDAGLGEISESAFLIGASKLLGLYLLMLGVPSLLAAIPPVLLNESNAMQPPNWSYIACFGLTHTVFGFLLMLKTEAFWRFVSPDTRDWLANSSRREPTEDSIER